MLSSFFFLITKNSSIKDQESVTEETSSNTVHNSEYAAVKEFVETNVIEEQNIIPLTALHATYIAELNEQGIQNVSYRTQKPKSRQEHDDDLKEHTVFNLQRCILKIGISYHFGSYIVHIHQQLMP